MQVNKKEKLVGKKLTIEDAIRSLSKKNDCRVSLGGVYILSKNSRDKKDDLGNSSWGKIDFLRKQGLSTLFVDKF